MKKITSIVLSVSMAAGALGMNTAVVHAEESAKKVAYISADNWCRNQESGRRKRCTG